MTSNSLVVINGLAVKFYYYLPYSQIAFFGLLTATTITTAPSVYHYFHMLLRYFCLLLPTLQVVWITNSFTENRLHLHHKQENRKLKVNIHCHLEQPICMLWLLFTQSLCHLTHITIHTLVWKNSVYVCDCLMTHHRWHKLQSKQQQL